MKAALAALILLALAAGAGFYLVRHTDEGRVAYKRFTAASPYVYDEVPARLTEVDVDRLIAIGSPEDVARLRALLAQAIWGRDAPPLDRLPAEIREGVLPVGFEGLAAVSASRALIVPIDHGYNAHVFVLEPSAPSGRSVVYQHGYAGRLDQAREPIVRLLNAGYRVAAINFFGYGPEYLKDFDHPRFGPVRLSHDRALYLLERPLRYYIEPVIAAVNHLNGLAPAEPVDMVGFSAGGWTAVVAAAVDPRIATSVSVAGMLPIYLRNIRNANEWPPPHLYAPLLAAANYLEMSALAASGDGRRALQVFNRYDRCCYRNAYGGLYEPAVQRAVARVGGGAFEVLIDETHADHKLSGWAMDRILTYLER